jgi:hypothetical protein
MRPSSAQGNDSARTARRREGRESTLRSEGFSEDIRGDHDRVYRSAMPERKIPSSPRASFLHDSQVDTAGDERYSSRNTAKYSSRSPEYTEDISKEYNQMRLGERGAPSQRDQEPSSRRPAASSLAQAPGSSYRHVRSDSDFTRLAASRDEDVVVEEYKGQRVNRRQDVMSSQMPISRQPHSESDMPTFDRGYTPRQSSNQTSSGAYDPRDRSSQVASSSRLQAPPAEAQPSSSRRSSTVQAAGPAEPRPPRRGDDDDRRGDERRTTARPETAPRASERASARPSRRELPDDDADAGQGWAGGGGGVSMLTENNLQVPVCVCMCVYVCVRVCVCRPECICGYGQRARETMCKSVKKQTKNIAAVVES